MSKMIVVTVQVGSKVPAKAFVKSADATAFAKAQKVNGWDSDIQMVEVKPLKKKELMVALFNREDWSETVVKSKTVVGSVKVKKERQKYADIKAAKSAIVPPLAA